METTFPLVLKIQAANKNLYVNQANINVLACNIDKAENQINALKEKAALHEDICGDDG